MSKKRNGSVGVDNGDVISDDVKEHRTKVDYQFEMHNEDGTIENLPLILHYPSEAAKVASFLTDLYAQHNLGDGKIRVCKKIYA